MIEGEEAYVIEQLDQHDRAGFSCGITELDRYLQNQAGQNIKRNMSVTYVLSIYKDSQRLLFPLLETYISESARAIISPSVRCCFGSYWITPTLNWIV